VFVSNNPFQPSLLFPGTTQKSDPKGALIGLTPTSLTTIILGCKGSPGDKRSSLFVRSNSDEGENLYNIDNGKRL